MVEAAFILANLLLAGTQSGGTAAPNAAREVREAPAVRPVQKSNGPVRRVEPDAEAGPLRGDLEIVDAGSEDVGALGASFRQPAHDSRLPTGFQRVYRVPGDDGKLMRGNGALFAVFPTSVYRRTGKGIAALTPPGTVYHIGMPGELHLAPEAPSERALAVQQIDGRVHDLRGPEGPSADPRLDMRIDGRVQRAADDAAPAGPSTEKPSTEKPSSERPSSAPGSSGAASAPQPTAPSESAAAGVYAHLGFGPARVARE